MDGLTLIDPDPDWERRCIISNGLGLWVYFSGLSSFISPILISLMRYPCFCISLILIYFNYFLYLILHHHNILPIFIQFPHTDSNSMKFLGPGLRYQKYHYKSRRQQQMIRKIQATSGIRQFHVCEKEALLLAIVYDTIKIYDVDIGSPILSIKLDMSPRLVKLAPNGNYFAVYENNTTITIYDTRQGLVLQKITDLPFSIKAIRFSKNSHKIILASTQTLCLWNIRLCRMQIRTQNWKNINCYDVNQDGTQFAIGTFNGTIFILTYLGNGKCTQIQIKRHKTCVVSMCFHTNKLVSVSYDGILLITSLSVSSNGDRLVTYNQLKVTYAPRQIESIGDNFYLYDHRGLTWFTPNYILVGFVDSKIYKPLVNEQGLLIFVKLTATELEWWPGKMIRGTSNYSIS